MARSAKNPQPLDNAAANASILIVDDEESSRYTLAQRLKRAGYRHINEAADGRAALEKIATQNVDIVLLDMVMQDLDGLSVLQELRSNNALEQTAVIVVTSVYDVGVIEQAYDLGAEDYVQKPFNPTILLTKLRALAERHVSRKERNLALQMRLEAAMELSPDGVLLVDEGGQIVSASQAFIAIGEHNPVALQGRALTTLFTASSAHGKALPAFDHGVGEPNEIDLIARDGTPIPVEVRAKPVDDQRGTFTMFWVRDVRRRKAAEKTMRDLQESLAQAAKASALTELGALVAHEVNQPLASIATYLSALKRKLAQGAEVSDRSAVELIDKAHHQSLHAAEVVAGLRRLVGHSGACREDLDVNSLVALACDLALADAGDTLTLEWSFATASAVVVGDRILLLQVLVNLLRNALEAQAGVERMEIDVATEIHGDVAAITIADRGPGLARSEDSVFTPLLSDKDDGMGLGLAIVRSIVERHEGACIARNREGGGAAFTVRLPLARPVGT